MKLFFVILSFFFVFDSSAQTFQPTHRVDFGGVISYEMHRKWNRGVVEYDQVCLGSIQNCFRGEESPEKAIMNKAGNIYEIRKYNLSGKGIYHFMVNSSISWRVYKNDKNIGTVQIKLLEILPDGSRIYHEAVNIPEASGTIRTTLSANGEILSQEGNLNGVRLRVQKIEKMSV